jgi:histidinol-phosphate aminotransferase
MDAQMAKIREERESLFAALTAVDGITVWPSRTNFILFRCERRPAGAVFERLRAADVLIKNLDAAQGSANAAKDRMSGAAGTAPPLAGCLRVTIGTPEENRAFLAVLRQAV